MFYTLNAGEMNLTVFIESLVLLTVSVCVFSHLGHLQTRVVVGHPNTSIRVPLASTLISKVAVVDDLPQHEDDTGEDAPSYHDEDAL